MKHRISGKGAKPLRMLLALLFSAYCLLPTAFFLLPSRKPNRLASDSTISVASAFAIAFAHAAAESASVGSGDFVSRVAV